MKIKRLILPIFLMLFVLFSCSKEQDSPPLTAFGEGNAEYSIVYSSSASDEELDLAYALGILSGEKAPLYSDLNAERTNEILVGKTNRRISADFASNLEGQSSEDYFNYLIAAKDGKIVIISDYEAGYLYAAERLMEKYVQNGAIIIPSDLYDLQKVAFDEYFRSAYYADKLAQAEEEKRLEEDQKQLEDELGRYEEEASNSIMTVGQKIEEYKTKIASFSTADFGEYTPAIFNDAISKKGYKSPDVYPTSGAHPRVLFTDASLAEIRENLETEENKSAYTQYMLNSYIPCDGVFAAIDKPGKNNMDHGVTMAIEAKAFRYALTGEKLYGYEAIYAIKNAILTLDIPKGTMSDATRAWGYVLYTAGCVYDWCYDLLTEKDKAEIVSGCVNLIGTQMEIVNYDGETNKAPTAQGGGYGHGSETQLLRDWFAFAIACYDE